MSEFDFRTTLDALGSLQPAWQIYLDEGNFSAGLVDRSVPDGSSTAVRIRETTGGGTAGTVGLGPDRAFEGWDGGWTLRGLYFSGAAPLNVPFQKSEVYAAYDPATRAKPVVVNLGFTTGDGDIIPFRVVGDAVDTVELATDPGWQSNIWYRYEVSHDGDGGFVGRLWPAGGSRPDEPTARSTGSVPPSGPRIFAASVNGARGAPLAVDHAGITWNRTGPGPAGQAATATVLSYVPGLSENDAAGGNDLHSAFPNGKVGLPPFDYSLDGVAVGDHVNPIEDDALSPPDDGDPLSAFLDAEKTVQGLSGGFNHYKFKNTVATEFETTGTTIDTDQTVTIKVNTKLPEDGLTVHGDEDSLPSFDVQLFDPENPEPPSFSIVEEGALEDNSRFNPDELGDIFDSRALRAHLHTRYLSADVSTFERNGESIDGVRVATLCGASSTFIFRRLNGGTLSGQAGKVLLEQDTPVIFSWIELSVLADGTKLVRMPHSSVFPKHAGYLGDEPRRDVGTKMDDSGLEVIYDTSVDDSGDDYTVAVNENENNAWNVFDDSLLGEVNGGADPFRTTHSSYIGSYREDYDGPTSTEKSGLFETPVMAFGRTPDGEPMSRSEVLDLHDTGSDEWYPLSPFDISYSRVVDVTSVAPGRPVPGFGLGAALAGLAGAGAWRTLRDGDDGQ